MGYITREEQYKPDKWRTWVLIGEYDTTIVETPYRLSEEQATAIREQYIDANLYNHVHKEEIDVYEDINVLKNAILFIHEENPNLTKWNNYLASLSWFDALRVRWFLAILAKKLSERAEVSLDSFTETEVLSKLKTFIINTPPRRLAKIIFGE